MNDPVGLRATSELYWISALVAAGVDGLLLWRLRRPMSAERLRRLGWSLPVAAVVFWTGLWAAVMSSPFIWETCYQYVFAEWARWVMPPVFGLAAGALALFFRWLALRLPGRPLLTFLFLGGLHSFPGHLWAIYGRGILQTPLLKSVSVASALVFGLFEFIFYWSVILILAMSLRNLVSCKDISTQTLLTERFL